MKQRIRFLKEITMPATGDHPSFLLAKKDELGWVHDPWSYGYLCSSDGESTPFFTEQDEFEIIQE